ncbi:MAG: TIM barrel protein [Planctomycetota bacterium]|nr:TIM barrel protein [Planctomycetota bacterium]
MIAGFHTASLLLHDPCAVVEELAQLGFGCVAIRPHPCSLNPASNEFSERLVRLSATLQRHSMCLAVDLDAPYFCDPWIIDGPSLSSSHRAERERAYDWIASWLEVAAELNAELVTFGSGRLAEDGSAPLEQALDCLASQTERLLAGTDSSRLQVAIRPRSGDSVATVAQYERLGQWLGPNSSLGLAADVGEMLLGGELPLIDRLERNLTSLACVYLCDRSAGVVGDQPLGEGDVALFRIVRFLADRPFSGPAIFRVEGHSELGLLSARAAMKLIQEAVPGQ